MRRLTYTSWSLVSKYFNTIHSIIVQASSYSNTNRKVHNSELNVKFLSCSGMGQDGNKGSMPEYD